MRVLVVCFTVLIVLLGIVLYDLGFGAKGRLAVADLQAQVQAQSEANAMLQQRNVLLAAEVADLKDGDVAVEELARTELGMIRPGEVFYRVVRTGHSQVNMP